MREKLLANRLRVVLVPYFNQSIKFQYLTTESHQMNLTCLSAWNNRLFIMGLDDNLVYGHCLSKFVQIWNKVTKLKTVLFIQ